MNTSLCHRQPARRVAAFALASVAAVTALFGGPYAARAAAERDDRDPQLGTRAPTPPAPAPPAIDRPDVALEFLTCRDAADLAQLKQALESSQTPRPEVRITCVDQRQKVGVWITPARRGQEAAFAAARDKGLAETEFLAGKRSLAGLLISDKLVRRVEREAQTFLRAHRFNDDLKTDDRNGKIHVRSFTVRLAAPNQVVTTINGFREVFGPNPTFTTTVRDTLSLDGRAPQATTCSSRRRTDVDADTAPLFSGPLGVLPFLIETAAIELHYESLANKGASKGAVGCQLAEDLFLPKIPIQGQKKIDLDYNAVEVSGQGIAGYFIPSAKRDRQPTLAIAGPGSINTRNKVVDGMVSVRYEIVPDDLLFFPRSIASDLTTSWSPTGATLTSPAAPATRATIDVGDLAPGETKKIQLRARTADSDGMSAEAVKTVTVFRQAGRTPDPRDLNRDPDRR
jgi:hypothetical protein